MQLIKFDWSIAVWASRTLNDYGLISLFGFTFQQHSKRATKIGGKNGINDRIHETVHVTEPRRQKERQKSHQASFRFQFQANGI